MREMRDPRQVDEGDEGRPEVAIPAAPSGDDDDDARSAESHRAEGRAALALLEASGLADVALNSTIPTPAMPVDDLQLRRRQLEQASRRRTTPLAFVPAEPVPADRSVTSQPVHSLEVLMETLETTRGGLELQGIAVSRNLRETETYLAQLRQVLPEALQTQANLRELASAFEAMRVQQTGALNNALGEVQSSLAVWRTNAESALDAFQTASTSLISSQGRESESILLQVRTVTERDLARLERSIGGHLARMDGAQQELLAWQQSVQAALQTTMIDAHQRLEEAAVGNLRNLGGSLVALTEKMAELDRDRQIFTEQIDKVAQILDTTTAVVKIWEHRVAAIEAETLPNGTIDGRVQTVEGEMGRITEYNLNLDGQLTELETRYADLQTNYAQMQTDMRVVAYVGLVVILSLLGVIGWVAFHN